jgi:excisionase family DNA binding protein
MLLSVDEAAEYLGISAGTLRNWISMRRIEYVKVGGKPFRPAYNTRSFRTELVGWSSAGHIGNSLG